MIKMWLFNFLSFRQIPFSGDPSITDQLSQSLHFTLASQSLYQEYFIFCNYFIFDHRFCNFEFYLFNVFHFNLLMVKSFLFFFISLFMSRSFLLSRKKFDHMPIMKIMEKRIMKSPISCMVTSSVSNSQNILLKYLVSQLRNISKFYRIRIYIQSRNYILCFPIQEVFLFLAFISITFLHFSQIKILFSVYLF